jgi:hypothetical protein
MKIQVSNWSSSCLINAVLELDWGRLDWGWVERYFRLELPLELGTKTRAITDHRCVGVLESFESVGFE